MRIILEDSIGLIVDIQERLFPHIYENELLIANTKKLTKGLNLLKVPLIVTEQYRKGLGPTLQELQEIVTPFNPMEKISFSCCDDTAILDAIEERGKSNVIIAGIETHVCILQTAIDLLEEGYRPIVVEDCVSSRKLYDKDTALKRLQQEGALLTSMESILFELTRFSGTPLFKEISALVK